MLNRLEAYNQSPILDLSTVDAAYVSEFGEYLVRQGVTFSTAKLFKMSFRAVMKEAYGTDFKAQFKAVFKNVGSKNETATNCISFDDLKKIVNCNLDNLAVLNRARNLFLYCVVSGGLSLQDVKRMVESNELDLRLPQQKLLVKEFKQFSETGFENYVTKLGSKQYEDALNAVGVSAGISTTLKPDSVVDGWFVAANRTNVPIKTIASVIPNGTPISEVISTSTEVLESEKLDVLASVANTLIDTKTRWFAMKCYSSDPTEMDEEIAKTGVLSMDELFSSFIPPEQKVPKSKATQKKSVMSNMYFFNCKSSTAVNIKNAVKDLGWVYTLAGTSTPAQISDSEMKTFMLLCEVSEGTLTYHFPDIQSKTEDLTIGREVKVTNGNFCGQVGVIKELPNNKYKVTLIFTSLCAKITAEVPVDFIRF